MRSIHAILSELNNRPAEEEIESVELNAILNLTVTLSKHAFAAGVEEGYQKGYQDAKGEIANGGER